MLHISITRHTNKSAAKLTVAIVYRKLPLAVRPTFYEIADSHGTDKVQSHHYEQMYEHRLAPFRDKKTKMLEIGLGCNMDYGPGASYYTVRLWLFDSTLPPLYYVSSHVL